MKNAKRSDGRVKASIYLGDGKYKYVYAANNKELEKKVTELKIQLGKGIDLVAERDNFEKWSLLWLKSIKFNVSQSRYDTCKRCVAKLEPIFTYSIKNIKLIDVQTIIYDMFENGYSKDTITKVKGVANQIMQLALDNRVIDFNPIQSVKIPKGAPQETRRSLTDEEQKWINAPSDNRGHRAAMIMMYAGLRRGELIPLLWSDIDLEARTIDINKSVEIIHSQNIVKDSTKTEAGIRKVYISNYLAEYLSTLEHDSDYVCPSAKGKMMSVVAFKRMWDSYLAELNFNFGDFSKVVVPSKDDPSVMVAYKKSKSRFAPGEIPKVIPRITPHWLRHTFITMMYMAGVDALTAKEQAGHADISTTLSIYTHLDKQFKRKQVSKLDDYLNNLLCGSNVGQ